MSLSKAIDTPNTRAERQLKFVAATSALSPVADSARWRLDTSKSPTKPTAGALTQTETKRMKEGQLCELTEVVQFNILLGPKMSAVAQG